MSDSSQFDYWRSRRKGEQPPIDVNSPQCGYYRYKRGKDAPHSALLINLSKDGKLFAMTLEPNKDDRVMLDPFEVWQWVANKDISEEAAKHFNQHGEFPGDAKPIGHNLPPDATIDQKITDLLENAGTWLKKLKGKISQQSEADLAANYRDQIRELRKEAEETRVKKKKPHDEAAKAVQDRYKPLIDRCDKAMKVLTEPLTKFLVAAEEAAKAEQEKAVEEIEARGETAVTTAPKVQAGGQKGKKTGLRTRKVMVITDLDAALEHFKVHQPAGLAGYLSKAASEWQRSKGALPPGCELKEERSA